MIGTAGDGVISREEWIAKYGNDDGFDEIAGEDGVIDLNEMIFAETKGRCCCCSAATYCATYCECCRLTKQGSARSQAARGNSPTAASPTAASPTAASCS